MNMNKYLIVLPWLLICTGICLAIYAVASR